MSSCETMDLKSLSDCFPLVDRIRRMFDGFLRSWKMIWCSCFCSVILRSCLTSAQDISLHLLLPWRHHSADLSLTNRRVSAVGSVENCAALGFRDLDQRSPQRAVNLHVYWCFLVAASRDRKHFYTCWPVGFTAPGLLQCFPSGQQLDI